MSNHTSTWQECTDLLLRNNDYKMAEDLCLSDKLRREVNWKYFYNILSNEIIMALLTRLLLNEINPELVKYLWSTLKVSHHGVADYLNMY